MHHSFCRIIALALSGLVGASALAAVVTVNPTGDAQTDTGNIEKAISDAGKDGTVELGEGVFLLKNHSKANDIAIELANGVTLTGKGWDKTILKSSGAQSNLRCIKIDGAAKLANVTVTGFAATIRGAGAHIVNGSLSWCCISNNTAKASNCGGGVSILNGSLDHCLIANNSLSGSIGAGIGGNGPSGDITIDTCLIYGNNSSNAAGGAVGFTMPKKVTIRNCTIADNTASQTAGGIYLKDGSSGSLVLVNSIVTGNTVDSSEFNVYVPSSFLNTASSSNSIITGEATGANPIVDASIVSSLASMDFSGAFTPGFFDAANHDYHLASGSPALDRGVTNSDVDLDNLAYGNPPALGCYGAQPGVAKPTFEPASGITFCPSVEVSLSCLTEGATVYYTTDGSEPSKTSGTLYSPSNPILITARGTTTIKAIAYSDDFDDPSPVVSATYTYAEPTPPVLGTVAVTGLPTGAKISGTVESVGNNRATSCDIYLAVGTSEGSLGTPTKIASNVTGAFSYTVKGLSSSTLYYYSLTASNNAVEVLSATRTGSFTTLAGTAGLTPQGSPTETRQLIQDMIDASADGTVYLAAGTFEIDAPLRFTNGASLVGAVGCTREDVIIKQVMAEKNALWIENSPSTVVSNLTVTAGKDPHNGVVMNSGLVVDCVIRDIVTKNNSCGAGILSTSASGGAGVNICGGVLRNCLITRCDAQDSAGAGCCGEGVLIQGSGVVENCIITECGPKNSDAGSASWGGAVCMRNSGTLRGCLIARNVNAVGATGVSIIGHGSAGAATRCVVENCTIANNRQLRADKNPAGLSIHTDHGQSKACCVDLRNNIIWGNMAYDGATEVNYSLGSLDQTSATFEYNDTKPMFTFGTANITADPKFVDPVNGDFRIGYSYCADTGSNQSWMTDATDLAGNPRIINDTVDMGCYEFNSSSGLLCRMRLTSDGALDAATVSLECDCAGGVAQSANWFFTRQQDGYTMSQSGVTSSIALPAGRWDIRLSVQADAGNAEDSVIGAVDVRASRIYVSLKGKDVFPYDTLEKGTPSIDTAFPVGGIGSTLYIDEGDYVLNNALRIVEDSCSRIESIAGPEKTRVRLANADEFQSKRNFGVSLKRDDACVSGITFVGGRLGEYYQEGPEYGSRGFVQVSAESAVLTNCVFQDLKTYSNGAYATGLDLTAGTVVDCKFLRIDAYGTGGNTAHAGVIKIAGGLADRLTIQNCDFTEPVAVSEEYRAGDVVGVWGLGVLRNSLISHCTTKNETPVYVGPQPGGTTAGGHLINCTIVANQSLQMASADGNGNAYVHAGGVILKNASEVVNCIIADNYSAYEDAVSNIYNYGGDNDVAQVVSYTLVNDATPLTGFVTEENHNIVVAPGTVIFHKPEQGDYTLPGSSPAVNVGETLDWMTGALDLAGNPRVISRIPDLGCYESRPKGLAIRLR